MSQENVEIVRQGFEHFRATGEPLEDLIAQDFVWDMSTFHGWRERQIYSGVGGMREFLRDWVDAWDDWELSVDEFRDAGDQVGALCRQRGSAKATGMAVDMTFAQVFTVQDGKQTRMETYASVEEALAAAGLSE